MKLPYTKPWNISNEEQGYIGSVNMYEQPVSLLDPEDYQKRLKFEQLKKLRLEAMCNWKQKDAKGHRKNAYIK